MVLPFDWQCLISALSELAGHSGGFQSSLPDLRTVEKACPREYGTASLLVGKVDLGDSAGTSEFRQESELEYLVS